MRLHEGTAATVGEAEATIEEEGVMEIGTLEGRLEGATVKLVHCCWTGLVIERQLAAKFTKVLRLPSCVGMAPRSEL